MRGKWEVTLRLRYPKGGIRGSATFAGATSFVANAVVHAADIGSAVFAGVTQLVVAGVKLAVGSATFAGVSILVANAMRRISSFADFVGSTALSASGSVHGIEYRSFVITGYSGAGTGSVPVVSTVASARSKMFVGGVNASAGELGSVIPLVATVEGSNGETVANGFADESFDALASAFVVSAAAQGNDRLNNTLSGSTYYNLAKTQVSAANSIVTNYYGVHGVFWFGGWDDQNWGFTNYAANLATFQSSLETDLKAITGQTADIPLYCHQQCFLAPGLGAVSPSMATSSALAALAAHRANPTKIILVGADYHLPNNGRTADTFTAHSQRAMGCMIARVAKWIRDNGSWSPVMPISLVRTGAVIDVTFHVPTPPLVFDLARVLNPAAQTAGNFYGFTFVDDSASATIASVAITGATTVRVTLTGTPTGSNKRLQYAVSAPADTLILTKGPIGGNRGCLRDSNVAANAYGYDSSNWCVVFEDPVT